MKMQKTRLGVAVGLLGAAIYLVGLYGGVLATALLVGYVLVFEENDWLKKNAVKAFVLMMIFSAVSSVFYLIPNAIEVICSIINILGIDFYPEIVYNLSNVISGVLGIVETLLFLGLALKSLSQGSITIPVVDQLIDTYMD